jgi:hypothetical protein
MTVSRTIRSALGLAVVGGVAVGGDALFGPYGGFSVLLLGGYLVGRRAPWRSWRELAPLRSQIRAIDADPRSDKYRVVIYKQLKKNRRQLGSMKQHLGRRAATDMAAVVVKLDDILSRWAEVSKTVEDQYTVEAMITDYFPGLLDAYRNLPAHRLRKSWLPEQERAWDALLEQVRILDAEVVRIQKSLYSQDLRSVEAHGTFLRDKYDRKPGLEIERD